ncbi:MAG: fibrobacter succinogenes major paralogous domain-containing protein [Fibromonadaceae bacterium]|jgi:uncharacterized protein (TIGR02145 family)|nr:fibrobacter succinogenes major paralogous domain-containing protein [Fibromonadaceae bacterium]
MKKIIILLTLVSTTVFAQQKGTFKDARDGKTYKTVKIGEQVWMAENLNYHGEGSVCHDNNPANCNKYGRFYRWETAIKSCPSGWHLPSNADWDKLCRYVNGDKGTESFYYSNTVGKYLKATSGWNRGGNGEDKFGFSALPVGSCYEGDEFLFIGFSSYWWSSSEYGYWHMNYDYESVGYGSSDELNLYSVRCIKN